MQYLPSNSTFVSYSAMIGMEPCELRDLAEKLWRLDFKWLHVDPLDGGASTRVHFGYDRGHARKSSTLTLTICAGVPVLEFSCGRTKQYSVVTGIEIPDDTSLYIFVHTQLS